MSDRIIDVGYRTLEGRPAPGWAPWPIARTLLSLAWRKRATKLALLLCLGAVGFLGVWLVGQLLIQRYAGSVPMASLGAAQLVGQAQEAFAAFVVVQFYFTAIAISIVAGGAVADDRHAGAMELYFSRPLRRADYAIGKLLGAGLVPFTTMVVPVFLLWILAVGIAPESLRAGLWWLVVPALAAALLGAAVLTTTIIGLSAISERSRAVSIAYVAGLIISSGVFEGLVNAGQRWAGYLAPQRALRTVVDVLLDVGPSSFAGQIVSRSLETNNSAALSALGLAGWAALGLGLLVWRLRRDVQA